MGPWDLYHYNAFFITTKIQWNINFSVIPSPEMISQQIFAHATTAELSCHVKKFVVIGSF